MPFFFGRPSDDPFFRLRSLACSRGFAANCFPLPVPVRGIGRNLCKMVINSLSPYAGQATQRSLGKRLLCADKGASALNEPICISVACVGFSVSSPALPTAFLHGSAPACVFCLYYNRIFLQDSTKIAIFGEKSKYRKVWKYGWIILSNRVCLKLDYAYRIKLDLCRLPAI